MESENCRLGKNRRYSFWFSFFVVYWCWYVWCNCFPIWFHESWAICDLSDLELHFRLRASEFYLRTFQPVAMACANVAGLNTNDWRLQIPRNWMHLRIQNGYKYSYSSSMFICMFHTFQWRKFLFPEVWKYHWDPKSLQKFTSIFPLCSPLAHTHGHGIWHLKTKLLGRKFPKIWEIRRTALYHVTANPLPSLHLLCSIMLPCYCERGNKPKKSDQGTVSVWRCFVLIVLKSAKAIVQFSTIRQAFIAELYVIVSSARSPKKKLWVQTHVERKDTKAEVLTPFQMYRYYWCTMMQQSFCTWDFLQAWYANLR